MTVASRTRAMCVVLLAAAMGQVRAADEKNAAPGPLRPQLTASDAEKVLAPFVGKWSGTCRRWSPAGKLLWELPADNTFRPREGGGLQHKATTRDTSEGVNSTSSLSYPITVPEVCPTDDGFYCLDLDSGASKESKSGWKFIYRVVNGHSLHMSTLRVSPDGSERKVEEFEGTRAKD